MKEFPARRAALGELGTRKNWERSPQNPPWIDVEEFEEFPQEIISQDQGREEKPWGISAAVRENSGFSGQGDEFK